MAEIIRVVFAGNNDDDSAMAKSSPSASAQQNGNLKGAYQTFKNVKKVLATVGATQVANSMIDYQISTISLRTGATEHQQRVQFIYGEASGAVSSIGAIAGGFMLGGPAGAGAAALGVGVSYIMKFVGWGQRANTLRLQQNAEDISIQMQTIRAGLPRRWQNDD